MVVCAERRAAMRDRRKMKTHSRSWFLQQVAITRQAIAEQWPDWMKEGRTVATAHFPIVPGDSMSGTQSVDRKFAQRHCVEVELEKARTLLKRATSQLLAWNEMYGRVSTTVLPPAGDVRLAEDIDEFLSPNV